MIRFGYTILYVSDVKSTLEFYETTFGIKSRLLTEEGDYGELETGETVFAFASFVGSSVFSRVVKGSPPMKGLL